jgi:ATP-binding protein involved in chromosome partitioning
MAKGAVVDPDGTVHVRIGLTTAGCPLRAQIQRDVKARIENLPAVTRVHIDWTELTQEEKAAAMAKARWNKAQDAPVTAVPLTTRVIMVASGKGGVGKSSISANIAAGLAHRGFTVGVLDADIWGFSIPRMLGIDGRLGGTSDSEGTSASPARKAHRRRSAQVVRWASSSTKKKPRSCGAASC